MKSEIKAVLFDSGWVLNYPGSGHWFISPEFFTFVNRELFDRIDKVKVDHAFQCAKKYINDIKLIETEEQEYRCFLEFYTIFANELPELQLDVPMIENIAHDLVYNPFKYIFFDDAISIIRTLSKEYKLAVVSDAWPSLGNVFEQAGMKNYFQSFIISSMLGVTKPDPIMYQTALEELGVLPENALFIDDNIKNCKGAMKLGIHSVLICRNKLDFYYNKIISCFGNDFDVINNLSQLNTLKCLKS